MKDVPVKLGDVLAGKYRVEAILGVGGMGVVVEATHLELQEPRAIKFMLAEMLEDSDSIERFLREARAASRLKGEHVARVHDVGRLENGAPYMVMELLEGCDLKALLKDRSRISVAEAVTYVLQACEALAEAHACGIIHRDLKPANLFVTKRTDGSPCVKVLDFGVSKLVGAAELEMTKTQTVLGSPSYMAPEQMRSARTVDARADVWSLGVILYRCVVGELPFGADNITDLVGLVLESAPPAPSSVAPDLPRALDAVLLRALSKDLDTRYANVGEFARAILPFAPHGCAGTADRIARLVAGNAGTSGAWRPAKSVSSKGAQSATPSPWADPSRPAPRKRQSLAVILAILATVLILAAGLVVVGLRMRPIAAEPSPASHSPAATSATTPASDRIPHASPATGPQRDPLSAGPKEGDVPGSASGEHVAAPAPVATAGQVMTAAAATTAFSGPQRPRTGGATSRNDGAAKPPADIQPPRTPTETSPSHRVFGTEN